MRLPAYQRKYAVIKTRGRLTFYVRRHYSILDWNRTAYDRLIVRWSGWLPRYEV